MCLRARPDALRAAFVAETDAGRVWVWLDEGRAELALPDEAVLEIPLDADEPD